MQTLTRLRRYLLHTLQRGLLRVSRYPACHAALAWLYLLSLSAIVTVLRRVPEITHIYVRRSAARGEIWPLLSDIDLTILTDSPESAAKVRSLVRRVSIVFPLLEPQSPVLERARLAAYFQLENFAADCAVLFRYVEAQHTWKLLYTSSATAAADLRCTPSEPQLDVLVLKELSYWSGLTVGSYSEYLISPRRLPDRIRLIWLSYKANLEVDNLTAYLLRRDPLRFKRSEMLRDAARRHQRSEWQSLVSATSHVAEGRLPANHDEFIRQSQQFVVDRYATILEHFSDVLSEQPDYCERLCGVLQGPPIHATSEPVRLELEHVVWRTDLEFESLEAVWLTPQLQGNHDCQAVLLVLVRSLAETSADAVRRIYRFVIEQLAESLGNAPRVEVNVVSLHQFLMMSVPRQIGLRPHFLFARSKAYSPSMIELLFTPMESEGRGAHLRRLAAHRGSGGERTQAVRGCQVGDSLRDKTLIRD